MKLAPVKFAVLEFHRTNPHHRINADNYTIIF